MADKSENAAKPQPKKSSRPKKEPELKPCGLVMPITAIGEYKQSHWFQVRQILELSATKAGFQLDLVSDARDVGVIHKRIVENLFHQELVVCDVSGRNPNVMFELGVRFAFDRPTVIVKDDRTEFSFDVQHIEHVLYPADLNYHGIMEFKERLTEKLTNTYKISRAENFSPFLENYRKIVPKSLKTIEVGADQFVIDSLKNISEQLIELRNTTKSSGKPTSSIVFHRTTSDRPSREAVLNAVLDYYVSLDKKSNRTISGASFEKHCDNILKMLPSLPDDDDRYREEVLDIIRAQLIEFMMGLR